MVAGRCLPLSMLAVAVLVRVATVIGDVAQLTPQLQSPPGFYLDGISTSQCLWGGGGFTFAGGFIFWGEIRWLCGAYHLGGFKCRQKCCLTPILNKKFSSAMTYFLCLSKMRSFYPKWMIYCEKL